MELDIQIVTGPQTSKVSKNIAEKQLRSHPSFPKNASVKLEEVEGRWIAAIGSVKEAEFPPSDDEPSDLPSDDAPESDDSSDAPAPLDDSGDDSSGDDSSGDDKDSEKSDIKHLVELVTTLLDALGINPEGSEDGPIPGLDEPKPEDVPGPPEESGAKHLIHERALKPGEAQPGATPIGAPAFASTKVADDHPWAEVIDKKRTFPVEEVIGEESLADVKSQLDALAEGTGYEVKQLVEARNDQGQRVAKALISK